MLPLSPRWKTSGDGGRLPDRKVIGGQALHGGRLYILRQIRKCDRYNPDPNAAVARTRGLPREIYLLRIDFLSSARLESGSSPFRTGSLVRQRDHLRLLNLRDFLY